MVSLPPLIASLLQRLRTNLSYPFATLYQNLFLLRFSIVYAARFPAQATLASFAILLSSFDDEWKMSITTSAFILGSNIGIFQLSSAAQHKHIRTMGFLSMAFASESILYSVILILHFSTLRSEPSTTVEDGNVGGENVEERPRSLTRFQRHDWATILNNSENERCVWWNASVLFALPAIWSSWAAIHFIVVLSLLLWYMDASVAVAHVVEIRENSFTYAAEYMPSIAVSIVLVIGGVCLVRMIYTLRSWTLRVDAGV